MDQLLRLNLVGADLRLPDSRTPGLTNRDSGSLRTGLFPVAAPPRIPGFTSQQVPGSPNSLLLPPVLDLGCGPFSSVPVCALYFPGVRILEPVCALDLRGATFLFNLFPLKTGAKAAGLSSDQRGLPARVLPADRGCEDQEPAVREEPAGSFNKLIAACPAESSLSSTWAPPGPSGTEPKDPLDKTFPSQAP